MIINDRAILYTHKRVRRHYLDFKTFSKKSIEVVIYLHARSIETCQKERIHETDMNRVRHHLYIKNWYVLGHYCMSIHHVNLHTL